MLLFFKHINEKVKFSLMTETIYFSHLDMTLGQRNIQDGIKGVSQANNFGKF